MGQHRAAMADVAVAVLGAGTIGAGVVAVDIGRRVLGRVGVLVFGLVVPDVVARGAAFVLAVRRRRSPDGLQREQHQQKEGD